MAYVNPGWVNGGVPAIDQDNLNEISEALELLPVENGGTGKTSNTAGSILIGNGTDPVGELNGTGALYAGTSGNPEFGTLPVSCGGTGTTTLDALKSAMGLANGGFVASATEPEDTTKLWIDTGNSGLMKYYDSDNSVWVAISGAFA